MADRRIFDLALAGLNRAHHHVADVGADTDLESHSLFSAQPVGQAAYLVLHPQRRVERPLRMIFAGGRRTEQREDAIAGGLHHISFVPAHRLDHHPERRVDNRAGLLGI